MFADLVGATELAGRVDPEDLRTVLSGYYDCCNDVVRRFDGAVSQFQGDGVVAHFGYPHAHEDDARRAVRCGLAITDLVPKLQLSKGVNLAVRVGICTGLVVVGEHGPERAAVGNAPNIAARLQSLAEPDQVVIEPNTRRLL
ncbi:MAG: adenylate/guanylate cyclase domain-containing protein, partial [Acetobacteraceae bacterium]|nr:adenylate/guanylate cyclase domain-containing protein [Acetobacteraceae bacterium]